MGITLDEAIKHAEEVVKEKEKDEWFYTISRPDKERRDSCKKCAEEHRQLAEWLKDYKRLKEQEPCEDAVSRQAVKEQMIKYGFHAPDMTVTEFVEDLPPVTPQPKTGHWIYRGQDIYECSECGENHHGNYGTFYCEKCGTRMR